MLECEAPHDTLSTSFNDDLLATTQRVYIPLTYDGRLLSTIYVEGSKLSQLKG